MNKIIYILSTFLSLLSISAFSQINAEIIRPSINASQFDIAVKAETALSKGQLSLNIPLMELKSKGYDLPISLMFYGGDVTFRTEASPVGLGWALMVGGVITKTIRGSDDLETRYSNKEHLSNPDYLINNWTNSDCVYNIQEDPMPDEYTYSLPGHSGTINVSCSGNSTTMSLFPDESYKIDSVEHGFRITADDGTKFYFEGIENRIVNLEDYISTSWFLTRIETTKGGLFTFNYAREEYVDLSIEENEHFNVTYTTQRITSIESDFGTVLFNSTVRSDRGSLGNLIIEDSLRSERINKIELRDEEGHFVKGYELDNSGSFVSMYGDPYYWCDIRHKLSSVTQYDSLGNRLPPYEFTYSYKFAKTKLAESIYLNGECLPRDSWAKCVGPQAYVDLKGSGAPMCWMMYPNTEYTYLEGIVIRSENTGPTADDYFCLTGINYPNGATDEFTYGEHKYSKVNWTDHTTLDSSIKIQGKRLTSKVRYGSEFNQRTDYVYVLHDSDYNALGRSSGVMTNPSIHYATYYTPEMDINTWNFRASRLTTGKAFNNFMGPPVCYTEVEEIERDELGNALNRTIHYFEPQIVSPPVNYIMMDNCSPPLLLEIGNRIHGTISGYLGLMAYLNNENLTYMAYPLGEFYNVAYLVDKPLKEVFIGKEGDVRCIKAYSYSIGESYMDRKYGYKIISQDYRNNSLPGNPIVYTAHLISMSEYITRRCRFGSVSTIRYYGNDSITEHYSVAYNKGRAAWTTYTRNNDKRTTKYYFPGDIVNIVGNNASQATAAVNGLIEKNMVADPIKTVIKHNSIIVGGECKDYKTLSGLPLLKSLYKLKNTANNNEYAPTVRGDSIDYRADLYKEGEIMTYDEYLNPEHVRLNNTLDRIYVWGYDGRYPVAIIDNMDYTTYQTSTTLRSKLLQLATYREIGTATDCANLRVLNAEIRNMLPNSIHITTYTYDPYFGTTSEIDDSNLGTIFTYDTFGRLTAKYDVNYKKLEEYNYHYKLQQ